MNVISSSYGNDSIALIQWAHENQLQDVTVVYIDTGWASDSWNNRVNDGESFAISCGFSVVRIQPDVQFAELMKIKKGFPNQQFQWCSALLKGIPFLDWIDSVDTENTAKIFIGKRRYESEGRKNIKRVVNNSEYHGGRTLIHPLYKHTDDMRNKLVIKSGFPVLAHRSHECHPCVNANREDFKLMNAADIEKVASLESVVGKTMFRPHRHNGAVGIVQVVEWAKRGKFIAGQEEMFSDIGCGSPFGCGL